MDKATKDEGPEPPPPAEQFLAQPNQPADELDGDSPAEVRVTFVVLMLVAALLCAIPRQWVSAGILLGLALVGGSFHMLKRRRPPPP
jgi:hypothetical protein